MAFKWFDNERNKFTVAENHKYKKTLFRTVVSDVSSFVGNPHVCMLLIFRVLTAPFHYYNPHYYVIVMYINGTSYYNT